MFLELIGTVFAGIAAAGVIMLVNRITGGRLPRWVAPVAAGLAMILVTISMEYSWYSRTAANLPEGVFVAQPIEKRSLYQPWTYVAPYVNRFVAVDVLSLRLHEQVPDQRIVDLYFFGRWAPLAKLPVLFDCAGNRRAILKQGTEFGGDGQIVNADWIRVEADDPVLVSACGAS